MSRAWVAVASGLALGSCLFSTTWVSTGWAAGSHRWDWEAAFAVSQPWRAFTAAWVHWSPQHLVLNLAACAMIAVLGWAAGLPRRAAYAWLLAWPMVAWTTQAAALPGPMPAAAHLGGLSGVLHAGVAVAAAWLGVRGQGPRRSLGLLLGLGLVGKLVWEWQLGPQALAGSTAAVSTATHLGGSLSGVLAAALMLVTIRSAVHQMGQGVVEGAKSAHPAITPQTQNPS